MLYDIGRAISHTREVRKINEINYELPYYDNLSRLDHLGT